jgi:hypothetical protein
MQSRPRSWERDRGTLAATGSDRPEGPPAMKRVVAVATWAFWTTSITLGAAGVVLPTLNWTTPNPDGAMPRSYAPCVPAMPVVPTVDRRFNRQTCKETMQPASVSLWPRPTEVRL